MTCLPRFFSRTHTALIVVLSGVIIVTGLPVAAQETPNPEQPENIIEADAGAPRTTLTNKSLTFDTSESIVSPDVTINEILWNFGDGTRTTGDKVTHTYTKPGTYTVRLTLSTTEGQAESTTEITVFDRVIILLVGTNISDEQITLQQQQAADEGVLILTLRAHTSGPEAVIEEDLTQQLTAAREEFSRANIIATWTSGGIGVNVLSRFAQRIKQSSDLALNDLDTSSKGVVVLTETPFGVLSPTAQATFDQLQPAYVLLTRPEAFPLLFNAASAEVARESIISSPIEYRLLGTFSSRAISQLRPTNFISFGINYLINSGIPINNIVLILMIPIIATILAFARQVIGIKAFGLITPAMTTLAFLVMGLDTGLLVFLVVLLSGTLTRFLLRKLRLLYLPRMALVLTAASLAILVAFGIGTALGTLTTLSFSIFPIIILIILAEEFIAAQFSRGVRTALQITGWTLLLAIACYYIVSWQLLRTFLLSYPEVILLTIPFNILIGRFTGLRVVEYIRFRELLRYGTPPQ